VLKKTSGKGRVGSMVSGSNRFHGLAASALRSQLMPFTILYCNDLKGTWYLTGKGGGCKNKTFFCHLCSCTKDTLVHYQVENDHCTRCKSRGRVKCFHHRVCGTMHVMTLLRDLEHQLGLYYEKHGKRYHDITARSWLLTNHMQGNKEANELHIDYVVPPSDDEKKNNMQTSLHVSASSKGFV